MTTNQAKTIRSVQKAVRPRPLKVNTPGSESTKTSLDNALNEMQSLYINLSNSNYDENTAHEITRVCDVLKIKGAELDSSNKSIMDNNFVAFRNASRDDRMDMVSRLKMLEVIELRAMKWQSNENITNYYKKKIAELEGTDKIPNLIPPSIAQNYSTLIPSPPNHMSFTSVSVPLAPGEILRSSGKFAKPTKISGKNYFKDEVVIRNSDSGKVNPGARDRLVQITGPNEEAISHAKTLVEDTIRRNASPMREKSDSLDQTEHIQHMMSSMSYEDDFSSKRQLAHSFSMSDASVGEFSSGLKIGNDFVTLTGANANLIKRAKAVLRAYFLDEDVIEKEHISAPYALSESRSMSIINDHSTEYKNRLQSSSSWMSTSSRVSVSPLGSSEEDETFRDNPEVSCNLAVNGPFYNDYSFVLPTGSFEAEPSILPPEPRKISYTREELLNYSRSPLCKSGTPQFSFEATETYPFIIRDNNSTEADQTNTNTRS